MNAAAGLPAVKITHSPGCALEPLPARAVASFSPAAATVARAIAGVMRNAQSGELPLFAWTLGLPQVELLRLVARLFPELGALAPLAPHEYAILLNGRPADCADLAALLLAHRAPGSNHDHARWLAHAIAAAAQGERHLWQDLGLAGRAELGTLLAQHFPTLHARNAKDMKWKRFLYAELATAQGRPGLRPPGCGKCAQFTLCFPPF